eukprot:CAMPEP_0197173328 /NCGR_PEP_ID=MMETSP1423-20130617/306_1 /TAXON_ID=476441 /ORGANISM="Pseudo-nitzschia heimii, Strain UNC1101" /LENGTH=688 /DNA_ID=CAMNT_0042622133 /DNA_START=162 /DNA_END=2228 /DNA_ORIENTATION=+
MSDKIRESPSGITALSSGSPGAPSTSSSSGLESIVFVALQALQKEQGQKIDKTTPTATLPTTSTIQSRTPPLPLARVPVSKRIISTDSIDEINRIQDSTPSPCPPHVQEDEMAKDPTTNPCSPPVESATTSLAVPSSPSASLSPSPSPMLSKKPEDEDLISTDGAAPKGADFSQILADPEGWLQKTENEFQKLPPVVRITDNDIVVQPNDVLCGRGGETNHHPGNIRYRSLVKAYQKLYLLAKRRDKPKIAQCIVVSVRGVNGRFLKRTKSSNSAGGSAWVDVGNVKAREKTSQALREGAPNLRENVNPPVTTSGANDSTVPNARQLLVPDQSEIMAAPSTASTSLATNAPTALKAMMGWGMPTAGFHGSNTSVSAGNGSASPVPPTSTSSSASPSDPKTEALTAQVFTKNIARLMQHPAFHQLDQARQQEAILYELKNAKDTVETATSTTMSRGKTTSPTNLEQGRTSPMAPSASLKQQQQSQHHHDPYKHLNYPYYHHGQHHYHTQMYGNYWQDGNSGSAKSPSGADLKPDQAGSHSAMKIPHPRTKNVGIETIMRDIMIAKANAATGNTANLGTTTKTEEKTTPADSTVENRRKMKKRPAPSASPSVQSNDSGSLPTTRAPTRSLAVVSDTGSDASSSSSSSCSSSSANNFESFGNNGKAEAIASASRGGSRLKRLKLRMKDDFD